MKLLLASNDTNGILKMELQEVIKPEKMVRVLKKMEKIMIKSGGIGIASSQVGRTEKMFVFTNRQGEIEYAINPEVIKVEKKTKTMKEACLSYPEVGSVAVTRPVKIKVRYHNGTEVIEKWLKGMGCRVFLHEMSHVEGRCPLGEV